LSGRGYFYDNTTWQPFPSANLIGIRSCCNE
jgi:hypothetical protein